MSFNFNLGGAGVNPGNVARDGCGSIFGIFFGILLIPLSLGLVYYGEAKLVNHGVVFARTAMVSADQANSTPEQPLCKFKGKPQGAFIEAERYDKPVVYWYRSLEQYESERDSDGDVTYSWETQNSEHKWASFSIGGVKIVPDKANAVGEKTIFKGVRRSANADFDPKKVDQSPQVGDQRLTIEVIDAGPELIVLGEVSNKSCSGGSLFVVSALDEAGTEAALRLEYKITYWVLKAGAVMAMFIGIMALFGPLMTLVGWIPFLGDRISAALGFGAFFFSIAIVGVATVAVKFFWVIAALLVVAIGFLIWKGVTTPRARPVAAAQIPTIPPIPPASQAPPPPPPPSAEAK